MINPNLKAADRIFENLPAPLKELMREHLLTEEEHEKVLEVIKGRSYRNKKTSEHPKFIIVLGQTGSGKSHLSTSIVRNNPNLVVIDSDKYKGYREDSTDIQREHLVEYAYLTAPDAYWHRDQMIYDAMENKYNILMECATSEKEGMFVDIDKIMAMGYDIEIAALGVSEINSLISVHERYEDQLRDGNIAAKLTSIARHDDSFTSLLRCVRDLDEDRITVSVYERGIGFPFEPRKIYMSNDGIRRFETAIDALSYAQLQDKRRTMGDFATRYTTVNQSMITRRAPTQQIEQLNDVFQRFQNERMSDLYRSE